jgi:hypothetical protein
MMSYRTRRLRRGGLRLESIASHEGTPRGGNRGTGLRTKILGKGML